MEIKEIRKCNFYLNSKSRSCKFPIFGDSIYCIFHLRIIDNIQVIQDKNSHNKNIKDKLILCPIDHKHYISITNILSHIRKCSKVRDIAYELSQPFCIQTSEPPLTLQNKFQALLDIQNFIKSTNIDKICEESLNSRRNDLITNLESKLEFLDLLYRECLHHLPYNPHEVEKIDNKLEETINNQIPRNKHDIQAFDIFNTCLKDGFIQNKENRFDYNTSKCMFVEFGAGNALLTHWFIKLIIENIQKNSGSTQISDLRAILIDKESRRKQLEKHSKFIKSLRLRLDIETFDFKSLIEACETGNSDLMYLSFFNGHIPWLLEYLVKADIWIPNIPKDVNPLEYLRKIEPNKLKDILTLLSRGGGPNIKKIEDNIKDNIINRPINHLFILAKHLCGCGFDLALTSSIDAIQKLNSGSTVYITMAGCCHHRCNFKQHLGAELITSSKWKSYFSSDEDCFNFITFISSWATGATDWRQNEGYKAKFILDTCRIQWLRSKGFMNVKLINYTNKHVTPENVLLIASKQI
ncbi:uncharacterized protein CMU_029620 [Cryptosporidium muris RN66]|uniref:tRNA:m(4)X modification enzyme TRM13 n=1 Tax=Cryptosporidium muris (strain RN66) TaxID=441375 RepID=B6AI46_CRYMR|nr:uncharacterized protein CMU_029620 [Cryptosporidium muris RN66]EEA07887.1 hypothetical protein, conserved [Cryptosporidium muris RN66]|eukprot:XP_002142236.1 hypothetical protein [Cryptosporidium muris RN66]